MFRRTRGMLVAVGAAAATVLTPLAAHATTAVSDGFETSPSSFAPYGSNAGRDCSAAHSGLCSLLLDPQSTSTTIGAKYTTTTSMGSRATVTFWFLGTTTGGDLDSNLLVTLNGGFQARIHMTDGAGSSNNNISLYTSTGSAAYFDSWASANTWYPFTLTFDTAADTVVASGPNATSTALSIPSGATSITEVDAHAVEWNGTSDTVRYDDIAVDTCTVNLLGVCV